MTWYTAVFLGLVQGLAEFLPISSSGHLLLLENWLGIKDGGLLLTVVLHLATLLAVVVVYRKKLWQLLRQPRNSETVSLVIATIVTCAVVLAFHGLIEHLFTVTALPFTFLMTGIYLCLPGWLRKSADKKLKTQKTAWWQAAVVGLSQGIAVVPGLSRSGLTITTGRLCGMNATHATDFSFLMSLPIILGSLLFELLRGGNLQTFSPGSVILAFVTAFVAGVVAIKFMVNLTRKIDLRWFAVYLLILGIGLLIGQVCH